MLFAALSVNAATSKTIWTGSETFDESWSGSFKIESTEFADLKAGDKVFITDTSTGNISVPKTITGGKCEITTSTGDIRISIKE